MKNKQVLPELAICVLVLTPLFGVTQLAQQNRYTLKVPGGLAFSESRGYQTKRRLRFRLAKS